MHAYPAASRRRRIHMVPRLIPVLAIAVTIAAAVCMIAVSPAQAAKKESGVVDASKAGRRIHRRRTARGGASVSSSSFRPTSIRWPAAVKTIACRPDTRTRSCSCGPPRRPHPPTVWDIKPGTPVFFFALFRLSATTSSLRRSTGGRPRRGSANAPSTTCRPCPSTSSWSASTAAPPANIGLDRFLAVPRQGTVDLPDPNILGAPDAEEATFVGVGRTRRWFGPCPRAPTRSA